MFNIVLRTFNIIMKVCLKTKSNLILEEISVRSISVAFVGIKITPPSIDFESFFEDFSFDERIPLTLWGVMNCNINPRDGKK